MESKARGLGIASLSLGCVSIVFDFIPVISLVCGIVGIVLAVKAAKEIKSGIITAGLVTSIVGTVLSFVVGTCVGLACIASCYSYDYIKDNINDYNYHDDDTFYW